MPRSPSFNPALLVDAYNDVQQLVGFGPQVVINRFIETLRPVLAQQEEYYRATLPAEDEIVPDDYEGRKDWIRRIGSAEGRMDEVSEVWKLADELVILAIYKAIEQARTDLLVRLFKVADRLKMSDVRYVHSTFPFTRSAFGLDRIEELRLLCNCIKHSGRVSGVLSRHNPEWRAGEPLANLDAAYRRNAPYVGAYWQSLVHLAEVAAEADGALVGLS